MLACVFGLCLFLTDMPDLTQVVQYILDLNDNRFSDAVIRQFIGNVCALSVQKFSSNVIEKVGSYYVHAVWLVFELCISVHPCR